MYTYKNPILPGYHPDPSIVRVGEDFYMVTSTFEFFPGVPIYHSKNLADWELIGHCLTDDTQLPLAGARNSGGIFAPTLRWHEGVFYMITTNVTQGGNFIVYTEDIRGKWSEPIWIKHRGIDPSLLFDDDGKVYFCGTYFDKDTKPGIALYEINPQTGALLGDMRIISHGMGGKYAEAPHIYKIDGWYYLMLAEGGTEYGHMETIQRAKSPFGPYEPCPHNPILSHRDFMGSPIQATGHADLVEDQNGHWWTVCLGIRPIGFAMLHNLGRETFLAPVLWEEGWPVIGDNGRISLRMQGPLPAPPKEASCDFVDNFSADSIGLHWNYVRNPKRENYKSTHHGMQLIAGKETLNDENPTMLAIRQKSFHMHVEAAVFSPLEGVSPMAGITAYYNKDYHYEAYVTSEQGERYIVLAKHVHDIHHIAQKIPVAHDDKVEFALDADEEKYAFSYRLGDKWIPIGSGVTAGLCTEGTMRMTFTGVYIGIFASDTSATFLHFSMKSGK